jgi:Fe-S-cluster-containing hydrogenase component 2
MRCIGFKACMEACPTKALEPTREGVVIKRDYCNVCRECVKACPASALEVLGKVITVDEKELTTFWLQVQQCHPESFPKPL